MTNTNTNAKVTIKDMFNEVIALAEANDRPDIVEFAKGRIAVLDKKTATKSKADKAKAEENDRLGGIVVEVLNGLGKPSTVSEIMAKNDELGALSNQKVSAILRGLRENGVVTKTIEKKKSYFAVV